jgi:CheY-like chemotaxis protein
MTTILIVEDENTMSLLLDMILRRGGYDTWAVDNGTDALNLIYQSPPDLIILDDMLPDITGSEICYQLKHDPMMQHIPVIMYSAGVQIHNKQDLAAIRADAALTKPSSPNTILNAIAELLSVRQPA